MFPDSSFRLTFCLCFCGLDETAPSLGLEGMSHVDSMYQLALAAGGATVSADQGGPEGGCAWAAFMGCLELGWAPAEVNTEHTMPEPPWEGSCSWWSQGPWVQWVSPGWPARAPGPYSHLCHWDRWGMQKDGVCSVCHLERVLAIPYTFGISAKVNK